MMELDGIEWEYGKYPEYDENVFYHRDEGADVIPLGFDLYDEERICYEDFIESLIKEYQEDKQLFKEISN